MARTLDEFLRRYNRICGDSVRPEDLVGKDLWAITPQNRQKDLYSILNAEDFFEDLELMPDSQEVLKSLSQHFEIYIATQATVIENSLGPKFRWLQRHFPFIPQTHYIFCGDKSILRAEYLIDDQLYNLERFEGTGVLFTAPHNALAHGYARVNNWREVAAYFAQVEAAD